MNSTLRIAISRATESALRDVNDLRCAGEAVECLLMLGGKTLISQKVYIGEIVVSIESDSNHIVCFEAHPVREA